MGCGKTLAQGVRDALPRGSAARQPSGQGAGLPARRRLAARRRGASSWLALQAGRAQLASRRACRAHWAEILEKEGAASGCAVFRLVNRPDPGSLYGGG